MLSLRPIYLRRFWPPCLIWCLFTNLTITFTLLCLFAKWREIYFRSLIMRAELIIFFQTFGLIKSTWISLFCGRISSETIGDVAVILKILANASRFMVLG
jgi:hypothetical protein